MFESIPFFHSYDADTKQLTLRGANALPLEVLEHADQIEILDLAHGQFTDLPNQLAQFSRLRVLFLSYNPITVLPTVLRDCTQLTMLGLKGCGLKQIPEDSLPPNLRWLVLTDNQLSELPTSFGELTQLKKLSLACNQLSALPDSMAQLQQLELLRLGANQLAATPDWVEALPNLAWYGDAGNPFSLQRLQSPLPVIAWNDLQLGERLGGSPSSNVYYAVRLSTQQPVAVKLYHSKYTSDGYARDDMATTLAAGQHPQLISALGQVGDHPDQHPGLVLQLISPDYKRLGLPPSLVSCTRDVYPSSTKFTTEFVQTIMLSMQTALDQLHEQGIMHGDFYAHNILVNATGQAVLGDFGAASCYDSSSASWRERIEARAYAILESELQSLIVH